MKTTLKQVLTLSLMLVLSLGLIQTSYAQKHVIKWAPFKLVPTPLPNVHLGYEGVVSDNVTLGVDLKLGIPASATSIPLQDSLGAEIGTFDQTRLSGFAITPQVRFYLGKQKDAPEGFYLNPFLRYFRYSWISDVTVPDEVDGPSTVDTRLSYSGFGGGLSIGYQWIIGEHFVIDWNVGAGITPANIGISGTVQGPLENDVQSFIDDVNAELDGLPLLNGQISSEGTGVNGNTGFFPMPLVRTTLAIGYAF